MLIWFVASCAEAGAAETWAVAALWGLVPSCGLR